MKKVLLASACLFALAAPASAADLAARPYTKAPVAPMASVYNWTGFYLGVVGGGAWENASGDPKMKGGFVGGTAGYNWQTGNVVFGLEADAAWADVSASVTGPVLVPGFGVATATLSSKTDAMGTVRGRIGWAVNNVLFYGTGGYAWIDNKLSASALGVTISDSKFHSGWTVGAGVEAFFAPNWTVKGEYLYRSLGGETYFSGALPTGTLNFHTVQVGVNYHFGAPVVAKY
ncbi:outer membrane protein [Bradyrhizobium sp. 62B]|jgi:outer membrane immunogenic protein|uniref:outer membrane protein n=1 Tax=Bradyrhizobium sp. 62B TaxID=2898442 RepID=UPI001B8A6C9C|nr:outer membrane protein [Bradyrhizobium diazoefficiens]MBR0700671.1 porin family protein [Bradyrhizobium diazoefficiens]MBR0769096.1 porin family protein [Bradyrhizobium diazoefficiens]WIW49424.1 outer membrane protein [Bradyrhizobium sp. 62B]